jgi:hypothetical protein
MGGILVCKLVKPTKVICSWAPHERVFGQIWSSQTEPNVGTAGAGILGKPDAAVRQELGTVATSRFACPGRTPCSNGCKIRARREALRYTAFLAEAHLCFRETRSSTMFSWTSGP